MMKSTGKLSLLLCIALVLQISLTGWMRSEPAAAATSGPQTISLSPADNMTNVPITAKLEMNFDEAVVKGTNDKKISIYKSSNNELFKTIAVSDVQLSAGSRTAVIPFYENFAENTDYYVQVDSDTFLNASNGAGFAGIVDATVWNFRSSVVDYTPPAISAKSPDNSTSAVITTQIVMKFTEPVFAASGMIELQNNDDARSVSVTSGSIQGSGSDTITLTLPAALQPLQRYTVVVPHGAFEDAAGNKMNRVSWFFDTAAAPVNLVAKVPADNKTLIEVNSKLQMTFDHNVAARPNKYIEIRRVSDNSTFDRIAVQSGYIRIVNNSVEITPTRTLDPNTSYYVLVDAGAFTKPDPNGGEWYHGISGAGVWNFATSYRTDTGLPRRTKLTPDNGSAIGELTRKLEIEFNEKVFPSSGVIEVREAASGALFRSIPVTSTNVTGGGSTKIVIDPNRDESTNTNKQFTNNAKYYVTIGNRAFRNEAGKFYEGISSTTEWAFTVTKDATRPTLNILSPLNQTATVPESSVFSAVFSEPIMKSSGHITINKVSGTTVTAIQTSSYVDPSNNYQLIIVPIDSSGNRIYLDRASSYYITIDANAVTDIVGNPFVGILNEYEWTFKTVGSDVTPPSLSKAESVGSVITLSYNEQLNGYIAPSPGSFYVSVNGANRTVSSVSVRGDSVYLTLSSPVVNGQEIKVSYTKATTGLIQDLSGNEAPSFSNFAVKNASDATPPTVMSSTASGSTVTLTLSEDIAKADSYAYLQFVVTVNGTAYAPTSIGSNGRIIMLTINGTIRSYDSVIVQYTQGQFPIRDLAGNYLASFSNYYVSNTSSQALTLQSASASGSIVTLKYNNSLSTLSIPVASQYSVIVDNVSRAVNSVALSGDYVQLTLSSGITSGQTVYVSYSASGNLLMDTNGNAASSFSHVLANGSSTGGGGSGGTGGSTAYLSGAVVKSSTLTLSFLQLLNTSYRPSSLQFQVKVNGKARAVSMVTMKSSSTVELMLETPVSSNETVTVTYYASQSGLRTTGGQTVDGFTDIAVGNQTSALDGVIGDYETALGGGLGLKTSTAVTTQDNSPAGVSAYRYTLLSNSVTQAYQAARQAGMTNPRVSFKVPDYEKAAIVAIPLSALDTAYRTGGDGVFGVQHGDITYNLPLGQLDFTAMTYLLNGITANGYVLVEIDQGNIGLTSALSSAVGSANASIIAGPAHMQVSVTNGTIERKLTEFKGYVSRTIQTNKAVTYANSAVVWLDPITGTLSYVPTTFSASNGTTTATFHRKGNSAYALVSSTKSFTDVSNHWAASIINTMGRKFIVEARSGAQFMPDQSITRGEFATYIAKGLGLSGDKTAGAKFKDVNSNTVMGAYIGAASTAGIVLGNPDGTFKPNNLITRQEMAAMMIRAATSAGKDIYLPSSAASYLQSYTDRSKVGSWAQTDVAKAIYIGVINGKTPTTISPATNATRAEGTVMLNRLLVYLNFLSE